ncbi:unnamed protein product, partial [Strongylus vulgaris]
MRSPQKPSADADVDVIDPYSEDRRIAMRQLYQDYEVEVPETEKTPPSPRVRPAVPAPPREPLIIAQYARRFPQPPASEGLHIAPPGSKNSVELFYENTTLTSASSTVTSKAEISPSTSISVAFTTPQMV